MDRPRLGDRIEMGVGMAVETQNSVTERHGHDMNELDVETALLTLLATQDVGPATESIRLDKLSATEKRVVLQLMRARIGYVENEASEPVGSDAVMAGMASS
jgi:hypothetical protein